MPACLSNPGEVTVSAENSKAAPGSKAAESCLAGSESLATLWARSKVEALEDSRIFGGDPDHPRRMK